MANPSRRSRRASSRAYEPCPHCGKRLHGVKGLKQHLRQMHPAPSPVGA